MHRPVFPRLCALLPAAALIGLAGAASASPPPLDPEITALIRAGKPLSPEQSLRSFVTEPGLRVELAAAEPLTGDPVAVAWDERGRMFVAENRGYPEGPGEGQPPLGVIALLEDTDGDGRMDKRTVFADGLTYPNGLCVWRGGLFVTCAPDIFYLKDTDGDGRADVKKVVLTGFEMGRTTQIRVSHPTLGPDGWIHLTSGLTGGKVTSPAHPDRPPVVFTKSDSRFHPDTFAFETTPGQGQFGLAFDALGRKFTVDNRHPLVMVVLEPRHLKRNPHLAFSDTVQDVAPSGELGKVWPLSKDQTTAGYHVGLFSKLHAGTFTSSCGISIYGGDQLRPGDEGNNFVCEPAQNLVQRQVISPNGAALAARVGLPGREFIATADIWFRPVFTATGPDGALYVSAMYRKFIDHPQYVPEAARGTLDFVSGRDAGRIYRVTAADKPAPKPSKLTFAKAGPKQLVKELEHANSWRRETARRLLLERADKSAVAPLKALAARTAAPPAARVAALRTAHLLGGVRDAELKLALRDKDAALREAGLLLAEPRLKQSGELAAPVKALADDPDPRVRFLTALALGELDDPQVIPLLARIATRDAADRWTRAAVLSSVGKRSAEFLEAILGHGSPALTPAHSPGQREEPAPARGKTDTSSAVVPRDSRFPLPGGEGQGEGKSGAELSQLLAETARVVAASQPPAQLLESLNQILGPAGGAPSPNLFATVSGFAEALRARKLSLASLVAPATSAAQTARDRLAQLSERAVALGRDPQQPVAARQTAIAFLAQSDFATVGRPLIGLLAPQQPTEVRVAAARTLGQLNDPAASHALLDPQRWRSYTPPVRDTVISALMSQPKNILLVLGAIETGDIPAWSIDATRRSSLMKSKDKAVREKAEAVFKNIGGSDRMKVFEEYKSILALKGDARNGHAAFTKACASCHTYGSEGARVGPDLTGLRNQSAEVLLLHILVPSAEIVAGFNAYEIETTDGRLATGLLASETPTSVTLRRAQGEEETILRSNIASLTAGNLSLMPDELEKTMGKQELRDLIAFLKGE